MNTEQMGDRAADSLLSTRRAYRYFGAHREGNTAIFRVFAPHADHVSVTGDFNGWNPDSDRMQPIGKGIWEATLPGDRVREGDRYKLYIRHGERCFFKADPYAREVECPPETASVFTAWEEFPWRDADWLLHRRRRYTRSEAERQPINIYELHSLSWMRDGEGKPLSYRSLARELSTYVKQMGYTHVELLPVMHHRAVASHGFRVSSYYAPSPRQGTPHDLMEFVNVMHEAGIGVIFDWVPAHFDKDANALYEFDGEPLYEPSDIDKRENRGCGTHYFDLTRPEVRAFLISNACFLAEYYHIDGLRLDAEVTLRPDGCGRTDPDAADFLREFNRVMREEYPDVITVAEGAWGLKSLTHSDGDGLGFTFRRSTDWSDDTRSYAMADPLWRCNIHDKLTRAMAGGRSAQAILPISHDALLRGRGSFLDGMPGSYGQKFAGARLFLAYLMTHPGKKLLFMGSEIGQFSEWNGEGGIEWFLTDFPMHAALQLFTAELNHFYLKTPRLWEADGGFGGFRWIDADNRRSALLSFRRLDRRGEELILLFNFSSVPLASFLLAVPEEGSYRELFNTDESRFGGSGVLNRGALPTEDCDKGGYRYGVRISLAPLSATVLERIPRTGR